MWNMVNGASYVCRWRLGYMFVEAGFGAWTWQCSIRSKACHPAKRRPWRSLHSSSGRRAPLLLGTSRRSTQTVVQLTCPYISTSIHQCTFQHISASISKFVHVDAFVDTSIRTSISTSISTRISTPLHLIHIFVDTARCTMFEVGCRHNRRQLYCYPHVDMLPLGTPC
jgi:hypothetical protein